MKFFLDTANVEDIEELRDIGIIDGVTTNPSLIASSSRNYHEVLSGICQMIDGPVSAEVTALDSEGMIAQGHALSKIASNIVIKLPCTLDGFKACKILSQKNIKTNLTLCFSAGQALIAAKVGASFISPFIGRLDDIAQNGFNLIKEIFTIYQQYETIKTEILVASIRNPIQIIESAKLGANIATVPPKILKQLACHPLTDKGLEIFLADWKKTGQEILI